MPNPTSGTTIQRPVLSSLFVEYMADAAPKMGGLNVLPIFNTSERNPDIPVFPREAILKHPGDLKREARGEYNRGDYEFETTNVKTYEFGYEELVDDVERKMYASYLDADEWAVKRCAQFILQAQEIAIAAAVFNATTFTSYTSDITHEWDDADNAVPYEDIKTLKQTLRGNCFMDATDLAIPLTVAENGLATDAMRNYLQYTTPHIMGSFEQQIGKLSDYLNVNVIPLGAYKDTALEGTATSGSAIWGVEYGMLFVKSGGDLNSPGLGRTFLWSDDSPSNTVIESYREENKRSDVFRARHHYAEKILKAEYGYLIGNMTTV